MTKASLEFLKIPKYSLLDIKKRRLEDWYENGTHLEELLNQYREDYREKICMTCSNEQKKKRKCHTYPGFDSNGNLKRSCGHMLNAQANKFRKKIYAHIDFHPLFYNPTTE